MRDCLLRTKDSPTERRERGMMFVSTSFFSVSQLLLLLLEEIVSVEVVQEEDSFMCLSVFSPLVFSTRFLSFF